MIRSNQGLSLLTAREEEVEGLGSSLLHLLLSLSSEAQIYINRGQKKAVLGKPLTRFHIVTTFSFCQFLFSPCAQWTYCTRRESAQRLKIHTITLIGVALL